MEKICEEITYPDVFKLFFDKSLREFIVNVLKYSRKTENNLVVFNKTSFYEEDFQTYTVSFLSILIPLGVVSLFLLFFLFYGIIRWDKDRKFCCCKMKKNPGKKIDPKLIKKFSYAGFCIFLLAFILATICIFLTGIIFIGYHNINCLADNSIRMLLSGGGDENNQSFIGINKSIEFIDHSNIFIKSDSTLHQVLNEPKILEGNYSKKIEEKVSQISKKYQNPIVRSCNPLSNSSITPHYFQNFSTIKEKLNKETQNIDNIRSGLENTKNMSVNINLLESSLYSNRSKLLNYFKEIEKSFFNPNTFSQTLHENFQIIYYSLWGFLSFLIILIFFVIIGCVCSIFYSKFHFFWCFSWGCLSFFSFLIFFLSCILLPGSIVLMESCESLDSNIYPFQSLYISKYKTGNSEDLLNFCFFESGNLNNFLGMNGNILSMGRMNDSLKKLSTIKPLQSSFIQETELPLINEILSFRINAVPNDDDFNNPDFLLQDLNSWSDYSIFASKQILYCEVSQDRLVLDNNQCGDYTHYYDPNENATQYFSQKICIDISYLGKNNVILERIGDSFENCTEVKYHSVGSKISEIYYKEAQSLSYYKSDIQAVFMNLSTDFQEYLQLFLLFQSEANETLQKVNDFYRNNDVIFKEFQRLKQEMNCSFLKKTVEIMSHESCEKIISTFYLLIILLLCIGTQLFFGLLCFLNGRLLFRRGLEIKANEKKSFEAEIEEKLPKKQDSEQEFLSQSQQKTLTEEKKFCSEKKLLVELFENHTKNVHEKILSEFNELHKKIEEKNYERMSFYTEAEQTKFNEISERQRNVEKGLTNLYLQNQKIEEQLSNRDKKVRYPWGDDDNLYFELPENHGEYKEVFANFHKTLSSKQILSIKRIQKKIAYEAYLKSIEIIKKSKTNPIEYDQTSKVLPFEKFLWHGTKKIDPREILENFQNNILNINFANDSSLYGRAVYFAENAAYSDDYCFRKDNSKFLLLCKVYVGESIFKNVGKNPYLPKKNNSPDFYDSVRGNQGGSIIYVIFQQDQNYPFYLVEYKD